MSNIASWNSTTGKDYPNNNGNPPYNNNPSSNTTATSTQVYKLNGFNGSKTGLGITLKVMPGDVVDIRGKSFWHSNGVNPTNTYTVSSALAAFITSFAGTAAVAGSGHGATAAALNGSTATTSGLTTVLGNVPNPSTVSVPKAYINWIFFDEQFKPVAGSSSFDLINTTADAVKSHQRTVNIGKGGYLYVYCSNESNVDVFFDNLQLIHTRGPLLEETHYYPFGLTMAGISSQSAGKLENLFRFNKGSELQHKEFSDGSGLEIYDTYFRQLDPQLGRWNQIDPKIEKGQESLSPYESMGNDPILYNDPKGDIFGLDNLVGAAIGAVVEYGSQVAENLHDGKSLGQALTKVSAVKIGTAAAIGFVTDGVANVAGKLVGKTVTKVAASAVSKATTVAEITTEKAVVKTGVEIAEKTADLAKKFVPSREGVLQKLFEHGFRSERLSAIGVKAEDAAVKAYSLIKDNAAVLKEGDNTLNAVVNGIQVQFKAFMKDGVVQSMNAYPGISSRVTNGTLTNLGKIKW